MPKYVYSCPREHVFEDIRSIANRDAPTTCETCGLAGMRIEIAGAPAYVTKPGVGDRSPFSRDRLGK